MNRLFCFGAGYSARALAAHLRGEGWTLVGTCRSSDKARDLETEAFTAIPFDGTAPIAGLDEHIGTDAAVLISIPPDATGDRVIKAHAAQLAGLQGRIGWVGYLSTTGVYGDRKGGWVDETSDLTPTTDRGRLRVAAEAEWRSLCEQAGLPLHIFRLAGIYGPGRNALRQVASGRARRIDKPGQVFSRIHVDDIAQTLAASIAAPDPGAVYNLCDDEAAPPQDVITYAARLLGREPPPLIPFDQAQADMSEMGRSFYAESKRVRNDRIKSDLGIELIYPDYRRGLDALFASGAY